MLTRSLRCFSSQQTTMRTFHCGCPSPERPSYTREHRQSSRRHSRSKSESDIPPRPPPSPPSPRAALIHVQLNLIRSKSKSKTHTEPFLVSCCYDHVDHSSLNPTSASITAGTVPFRQTRRDIGILFPNLPRLPSLRRL